MIFEERDGRRERQGRGGLKIVMGLGSGRILATKRGGLTRHGPEKAAQVRRKRKYGGRCHRLVGAEKLSPRPQAGSVCTTERGPSWDLGFVMFVACKLEEKSRMLPVPATNDWQCQLGLTRFGGSDCSGK